MGSLWWSNRVVKKLRGQAKCQRLVLAALQELNWPPRIDDPLPPSGVTNPKECRRQTVRHLDARHAFPALQFWVAEDGEGISWGPV